MKKIKLLFFVIVIGIFTACTTAPTIPTQKSNLTFGMVKDKIIKGETNQSEILQLFGAPNMITKNRSNDGVWSYNKISNDASASSTGSFFLIGSSASATRSSTTSSFDVILIFDNKDIVKDYSVISSSY